MEKATYHTRLLSNLLAQNKIGAMDLVRLAGVAVSTAYKMTKGRDVHDFDVFYKVYHGLRNAGYELTWEDIVDPV